MKRLLIITPTLGHSKFLDEVIQSVRALPWPTHHVLSCPVDAMDRLRLRYPHCHVVRDAGKAGAIYGALNAGLLADVGDWDWFTYINDDDVLLTGFGEMINAHVAAGRAEGVAYGDVGLIDERGTQISQVTVERSPAWIPALLHEGISPLMQQGTIFSRTTVLRLANFDLRYKLCADLDFWLRAYVNKAGFRHYKMKVAAFRIRSGQLSGNTVLTEKEQDDIVRRHLPAAISIVERKLARFRYRLLNLPRYTTRIFRRGFRTSYQILQGGEVNS